MGVYIATVPLTDLRYQKRIATATPEDMIAHLVAFVPNYEPQFSAGDWFAAKVVPPTHTGKRSGQIRFHEGYRGPMELQEKFDMYVRLQKHGLAAVEAHYHPKFGEINEKNVGEWLKFHRDTGLRVKPALNAHWDRNAEWGMLSSPYPAARKMGVEWLVRTLILADLFGEESATVWPGNEGYTPTPGYNVAAGRERLTDSVAKAMDQVPGKRVSAELKPGEPQPVIHFGQTPDGLVFAYIVESKLTHPKNKEILAAGTPLVVFGPETGHGIIEKVRPGQMLMTYAADGRLIHEHNNDAPYGEAIDWDFNMGTACLNNLEDTVATNWMIGYNGLIGIDIDPAHMDTERAILNNIDAFKSTNYRMKRIDLGQLVLSTNLPNDNRGYSEQLILRSRAHPDDLGRLSPMPDWTEPERDIILARRPMMPLKRLLRLHEELYRN